MEDRTLNKNQVCCTSVPLKPTDRRETYYSMFHITNWTEKFMQCFLRSPDSYGTYCTKEERERPIGGSSSTSRLWVLRTVLLQNLPHKQDPINPSRTSVASLSKALRFYEDFFSV